MRFQLVKNTRIIRDAIIIVLLFSAVTYFFPAALYLSLGLLLLCMVKILYRGTHGSIEFADNEMKVIVTNILGRNTTKVCPVAGATYQTGIIKYLFGSKQAPYLEVCDAANKKMLMIISNGNTISPDDIKRMIALLTANGIQPGGHIKQ
ncbi:hypothetical protein [Chitinophaga sp. Cy-1792]|uniref:hypothetical protein n=1 Tax=Chitinophaga sp. Cy-1792 TaxID=2608339 RepID=UPI00141E9F6C|nr:hypothetical protein [Chitinophaga sp. Cy-1792]NIG55262.1 hypothetical protein [Chitinophaga sp. Cy-1792]